jgi:hypothetical protein
VAPRDREVAGVPLEADWPDLDGASHRVRVDYGAVQQAGTALAAHLEAYQHGPGSPQRLAGAVPDAACWGAWESAAPVHAAAQEAMRHVLAAYRLLLQDYEAASHLLLRTAQNYADADAGARAAGGDAGTGRW